MVGKPFAKKLGVCKRTRKANGRQVDGYHLYRGNFIVDTSVEVFDFVTSPTFPPVSGKFSLDAEVLDIGNKACILGMACLTESVVLIDTQERSLRNAIAGLVIPCSLRWIASDTVLDWYLEPLVDGNIMLIIDTSKLFSRYTTSLSSQQVARLLAHEPGDHEIPLQEQHAKISEGAGYQAAGEEDEALPKYLDEKLTTGQVRCSCSAAGAPILFVRKQDGFLSLVVDNRALNRLRIPNKYPLPLISELLDKTRCGK